MKRNVDQHEFIDAFSNMGRGDSFSYNGKNALFDHLVEYEEGTGEEIELDVIGLCCDYSEHETALEAAEEYGFEQGEYDDDDRTEEEQETAALEWLNDRTVVIAFDGGVIIQGF